MGLFYGKVKRLQRLCKAHKQKRVDYATERKNFDYSGALFSDEKTFQLGAGEKYVWQEIGNREVREYAKHAPKVYVWAAIGSYAKTKIIYIRGEYEFRS